MHCFLHSLLRTSTLALTLAGCLTGASLAAPVINLTLTTPTISPAANGTVTVTLKLVDTGDTSTGPGSALFSFDTSIGINTTFLTFVGGFTPSAGSPFTFNDNPPNPSASKLRVAYDINLGAPASVVSGPLTLGSFIVQVAPGGLPAGGTIITLGSQVVNAGTGGSEVINSNSFNNVLTGVSSLTLTPAPELSGWLCLALGIGGLSLLTVRRASLVRQSDF